MRIYYATRTGRGCYCHLYAKGRCAHRRKISRGGYVAPLLSDKLGAGVTSKPQMNSVISKLGKLSLGAKKNNIRFDI